MRSSERREPNLRHPVAELLGDGQGVGSSARVPGHDELVEAGGVGDGLGVGHPVEDAARLLRRRTADARAVGAHQLDAHPGGHRIVGVLAEARVAGAVLPEHRRAVEIADDLVRERAAVGGRDRVHVCPFAVASGQPDGGRPERATTVNP